MKCKITKLIKIERNNFPPRFIVKAVGIRDEIDICDIEVWNDFWGLPKFEKILFPPTIAQAKELEERIRTDDVGNVIGDNIFIRLMSYRWVTPSPYYKVNHKSVTDVDEAVEKTEYGIKEENDEKLLVWKIRYIPKIYSYIDMTLFETEDGKCAENGGDADGICKRVFDNAVASGRFLLQKSAVNVKEVVEFEEELECDVDDKWDDYYNYDYYNDGLDMDQQDERFWNF